MDERVKEYLEYANSHLNTATGDNHGQDREFHTRTALTALVSAVEALAGLRWHNGELVPVEQPAPAAQPVPVCPLCGQDVSVGVDGRLSDGEIMVYCAHDGCRFHQMRFYGVSDESEALRLFARITGQDGAR